jgi:superfamily II DNA or RNA helicase
MQIQLRPHQERGDIAMQQHNKGQLIYPTGGGKTLNMIMDAVRQFQSEEVIFEKEYHYGEFVGGTTTRTD